MDHDALPLALTRARDAGAACRAVADQIAGEDGLLPSVYLERAGRLRCQAARGYWQLVDALPPGTGIVGRTWRTGKPHVVEDVREEDAYLAVATGVRAEA